MKITIEVEDKQDISPTNPIDANYVYGKVVGIKLVESRGISEVHLTMYNGMTYVYQTDVSTASKLRQTGWA